MKLFNQPLMQADSTVATLIPATEKMIVVDTALGGGDKFTYDLWMDLATRNPTLMMQSIPTKNDAGQFQFVVMGKVNIQDVLQLMAESRIKKHQDFAAEITERYASCFDENQKSVLKC